MRIRVGSRAIVLVEVVFIELRRASAQIVRRQLNHDGLTRRLKSERVSPHRIMEAAGEHPSGFITAGAIRYQPPERAQLLRA
jgi:hypothetical protein